MMRTKFFPFDGGENLVDPVIVMNPGELHDSMNYELSPNGGYSRVKGYERFDGQASPTSLDKSSYVDLIDWADAVETQRALIGAVPGSGGILGIWEFNGVTYAFRNNAGGTAAVMHKATAAGWVEVGMNYRLDFTAGTTEIKAGDTVEGVTSGATAVVSKIFVSSGTWGTSDAAGRICFRPADLTGNFQAGELLKVASVNSATNTAQEYLMTFSPGGRYEFVNYNFYGATGLLTMYGVNGVGNAFGFDGTDVWFIETGMVVDTPNHIFAHKNHLFLSFPGGSIQHSSIGIPEEWNAITGASEIAIGQECSGFSSVPGEALLIAGRNSLKILNGTSVSDWSLVDFALDSGAIDYSIQSMGTRPFYLDDRGIKNLATTQAFGDFNESTISQKIKPYLDGKINNFMFAMRVRSKDQYRLFFDDGIILNCTFNNGKIKGITKLRYGSNDFPHVMTYAVSVDTVSGQEGLYSGDANGYVYKLDYSNSFDGAQVEAYIRPVFYHFGTPQNRKRFTKMVLEISATQSMDMSFIPEFSYGDPLLPAGSESDIILSAGSGVWGESYWGQFYWDSQSLSTAYGYMSGYGTTVRLVIKSLGTYEEPHNIQGISIYYSVKGLKR